MLRRPVSFRTTTIHRVRQVVKSNQPEIGRPESLRHDAGQVAINFERQLGARFKKRFRKRK